MGRRDGQEGWAGDRIGGKDERRIQEGWARGMGKRDGHEGWAR